MTTTTTDPMIAIVELRTASKELGGRLIAAGGLEHLEAALELLGAEEALMVAYYAALVALGEKEPIDA